MLIVIFGESCTGKSTLANRLTAEIPSQIMTGKDYLRLAKNEQAAKKLFTKKLSASVAGDNMIYVVSEKEHLSLVPEGAVRILVTADIDLIKERFAMRMGGNLPTPVAAMLERKHGMFDSERCDYHMISNETSLETLIEQLRGAADERP